MKENSTTSWIKNNISSINILTILLYGTGFLISEALSFSLLINLIGFIYLLFITPLNILLLLHIQLKNFIEYLLACLVIFFTVITPLFFISNYLLAIPFTFNILLLFNIVISTSILILFYKKSSCLTTRLTIKCTKHINISQVKKFIKRYWPLLLVSFLYILTHAINYRFYVFMPEWDGYTKLYEIENVLTSNIITYDYRGFFTIAIVLISRFTQISSYDIFTSWFILLQLTQVLVLYNFIYSYKIKNKIHQFVLLLSVLAIPVLNMEIDMTRPHNAFLLLFPVYLYFIYQAFINNKYSYWLLASFIALFGLNYHEFFIFILFIHLTVLLFILLKKFFKKNIDKKEHLILILLLVIFLFSLIILNFYTSIISSLISRILSIFTQVSEWSNWRWWFLSDYAGDESGQQVGWPGIFGALKYYSYYISPLVVFILSSTCFLMIKKHISLKTPFLKIIMPLLLLLITYTEILPRLGYLFLPERILIAIVFLGLFLLPLLYKTIQKKYSPKILTYFLLTILSLTLIGLIGSFYVACQKKSLTSVAEFEATQWIKHNTPENAFFITQAASGVTIKYFANRSLLRTPPGFFNGKPYIPADNLPELQTPLQRITNELNSLQKQLRSSAINTIDDVYQTTLILNSSSKRLDTLNKKPSTPSSTTPPSIYAFYSYDKFKGLYAQREWWLKANYYGAEIENLTKKYPLVYNKNGIYIWKIK